MDERVIDLMRDQFRTLSEKIDTVHTVLSDKVDTVHDAVQSHVNEDKQYWAKINEQEGQMSVWKWLTTPGLAGFFAWLYNSLRHW